MKYLIVGLGNPGSEYAETRHNIGFKVLDELAASKAENKNPEKKGLIQSLFSPSDKLFKTDTLGEVCTIKHKSRTLHLLKPSTYMNLSGKAVRYWMTKHDIPVENMLVVLDDLNLPFGKIRIRASGSDGGHNGLKDIDRVLGNNAYPRMRMGISDAFDKGRQVDYVLGKWDAEERKVLPEFLKRGAEACLSFSFIGIAQTMSMYNK